MKDTSDIYDIGSHWDEPNPPRYSNGVWQSSFNAARFTLDGSYYGDWIHIQLPAGIHVTKCSFTAGGFANRAPAKFQLYGSNDGSTWESLYNQESALTYSNSVATVNITSKTTSYTYIGMVAKELTGPTGGSVLVFKSLDIYGVSIS